MHSSAVVGTSLDHGIIVGYFAVVHDDEGVIYLPKELVAEGALLDGRPHRVEKIF